MRHLKKKAESVLKILYVLGQVDIVYEISTFESNDNAQETKQMSSLPICKDNSWFLVRRRYEITENHRISIIYRRYTYNQKGAYRQEIKFIPIFKKNHLDCQTCWRTVGFFLQRPNLNLKTFQPFQFEYRSRCVLQSPEQTESKHISTMAWSVSLSVRLAACFVSFLYLLSKYMVVLAYRHM